MFEKIVMMVYIHFHLLSLIKRKAIMLCLTQSKLPNTNTLMALLNQFPGPHSLRQSRTAAGTAGGKQWDESAKFRNIDFSSHTGMKYLSWISCSQTLIKLKVTIRGGKHLQNKNKRKAQHVLKTLTWLITILNQQDAVKILGVIYGCTVFTSYETQKGSKKKSNLLFLCWWAFRKNNKWKTYFIHPQTVQHF